MEMATNNHYLWLRRCYPRRLPFNNVLYLDDVMSNFEWLVIGWLCVLTVWLFFFKKGKEGEKGDTGSFGHSTLDVWAIEDASLELLDDSKYIAKMIKKINSLQISSGSTVGKE